MNRDGFLGKRESNDKMEKECGVFLGRKFDFFFVLYGRTKRESIGKKVVVELLF